MEKLFNSWDPCECGGDLETINRILDPDRITVISVCRKCGRTLNDIYCYAYAGRVYGGQGQREPYKVPSRMVIN